MKLVRTYSARNMLFHCLCILLISTVAHAAPSDLDGDGISDFIVARPYQSNGCSLAHAASMPNCLDSNSYLKTITWFSLGASSISMQTIVAAEADGSKAYTLDPTSIDDVRRKPRLLRQDSTSVIRPGEIARIAASNDYCILAEFGCEWSDSEREGSSLSVADLFSLVGANSHSAQQMHSFFAKLDGSGEKMLTALWAPDGIVFAPHRSIALPPERSALYFPDGFPVVADYNGDGRDELAVWGAHDAVWTIRHYGSATEQRIQWGLKGDHPMPGDYDGDRKADLAVWRPSNGYWYILTSSSGYDYEQAMIVQFGLPRAADDFYGDKPVKADFDGDGKLDLSVFRPSSGTWYFRSSRHGSVHAQQWGLPDDHPIGMGIVDKVLFLQNH